MSWHRLTNNAPSTQAVAIYDCKTFLKTLGWTVPRSGDSSTYNSTGDQISSGGSGAGGLDAGNSWFVLQDPGIGRSFCIQKVSTTWRVKYSKGAGFTGGSPSATRVPSATDEQTLLGSGTDASPTGAAWFAGANGAYHHVGMADDATPYGFWFGAYPTSSPSSSNANHAWVMDPLRTGYPSEDVDPVVHYLDATTTSFGGDDLSEEDGAPGPLGYLASSFVRISLTGYWADFAASAIAVPATTAATDPATGKHGLFPALYFRRNDLGTEQGPKGWSSLIKWASGTGTNNHTLSVVTSRDHIKLRNVALLWDGSVPPGTLGNADGFSWDEMDVTAAASEPAVAANTTTLPAIIEKMITTIEALTPTQVPGDRMFRRLKKSHIDLREWATENNSTSACLRMFSIEQTGDAEEPPLFDPSMLEHNEEVTITVAYPNKPGAYRTSAGSTDGASDRDDMAEVIRKDATQIRDAIFSGSNYVAGQQAAFVTIQRPDKSDGDVTFQDLTVRVIYRQAQSL